MKRNKLLIAGTGIAAAGVAIFTAFSWNGGVSKYTPSSSVEITLKGGGEEGAHGAAQWWFDRHKNQVTGEVDPAEVLRVKELAEQARASAAASRNGNPSMSTAAVQWTELGPDNVGGRTRAVLIDNQDPTHQHMWAGGVGGGLFESFDGANNWQRCAGFFSVSDVTITVTTIAQAPNGTLYVGTGEGSFYFPFGTGAGGFVGGGVYKSTDDGVTWAVLPSTVPTTQNTTSTNWLNVNKIQVDPSNNDRIYAATNRGLKVSTDAGVTWGVPTGVSATNPSTDVQVSSDGSLVVAVISGKPWRSVDNGASFQNVGTATQGFTNSSVARTTVAVAPSDQNYVYAFCSNTQGVMFGVWVSIDGAQSWTQVTGAGNSAFDPLGGQGTYDNIVAVDPFNPKHAVFGGVELWQWEMVTDPPATPAGQWTRIAVEFPNSPFNPYYVHSDKHAVTFHPTQQGTFFVGTDGGISRTTNGGQTYVSMNSGYNVTQFYSVAHDHFATTRDIAMGGTQDNGTQYIDGNGNTDMSAFATGGGDGGWCDLSYINPLATFQTVYYGSLSRSNNGGQSSSNFYDSRITSLANFGNAGFASFITPIRLWESTNDVLSGDSITFVNNTVMQNKHTTNGIDDTYTGTLTVNTPVANPLPTIILGSVKFVAGNDTLTSNGAGAIGGDGFGSIDGLTGVYTITFNTLPVANVVVKAIYDVQYGAGTVLSLNSNVSGKVVEYTTPFTIGAGDSVKAQDVIQSHLAVGFTGSVWLTRRALDFSTTPLWLKIAGNNSVPTAFSGETSSMAWSADGNHLFVGTNSGRLYRISNLAYVTDSANGDIDNVNNPNPTSIITCTLIGSFSSRTVTGVDVDPNNADKVVVSLGSYGNTDYVYYSSIATTATTTTGTFTDKTGTLDNNGGVPTYTISFDQYDAGRVLVGTEHGVYEVADIAVASPQWQLANTGMDNVAVDQIRQQRWPAWLVPNAGCFYIGTHGRGIWRDDSSWQQPTGINNPSNPGSSDNTTVNKDLKVFPNPVVDNSNVTFKLAKAGDATVQIFDLNGKLVYTKNHEQLSAGLNTVQFESGELVKGTYIIVVMQNAQRVGAGRFLKMN